MAADHESQLELYLEAARALTGVAADHESQLELCLEAARALFPDRPVDGRLLYLS